MIDILNLITKTYIFLTLYLTERRSGELYLMYKNLAIKTSYYSSFIKEVQIVELQEKYLISY